MDNVTLITALVVAVFGSAGVTGFLNAMAGLRAGVKKDEREAAADLARARDAAEDERDAAIDARNAWRETAYLSRIVAINCGASHEDLPPLPE